MEGRVSSSWLRGWLDPANEFNQSAVVWLGGWSWWAVGVVLLLIMIALWLAWQSSGRLRAGQRGLLMALRALGSVCLFLLFLQPTARLEDVTRVKNHIAVLVDGSRSMSLPGRADQSRWQEALVELRAHQAELEHLSRDHIVTYYRFDEHLERFDSLEALASEAPSGESTLLTTPLEELLSRTPADELAGVWLISDGVDTALSAPLRLPQSAEGAEGTEGAEGAEAPASSEAEYEGGALQSLDLSAQRVKAPIHTLTLGPTEPLKDVSIVEVRADDFAFARNVVSVDVIIVARGYQEPVLRHVTLKRGGRQLAQKLLRYDPSRGVHSEQVRFEFVPEETGEEAYTVDVQAGPEEEVTLNNRAQFSMKVIRDKIRVLQVVGRPSWDERALRHHLQSNPNVELISFFILRTNASIETASPDELSLIPFPTQELFEERLGSFDLMVFQNFTYKGYRMSRYLPLIRDYVRQGGGFVMVGGDLSMSAGGYAGTPIAELLPFELPPNASDAFTLGDFTPALSPTGLRHPITALSLIPEENEALWARLPKLGGHNHAGPLKPDAQTLAWRPLEGGRRAPIISAMDVGEGRSLAISTDSLWRWTFEPQSEGATYYHRLWGNAIRWLIRDPSLNPIKVSAGRERAPLGADIELTAQVLSPSYEPVKGATVQLTIEEISDGLAEAKVISQLTVITQEGGEGVMRWRPEATGAYRVRARAAILGAELSAQDIFVVAQDPLELREVSPKPHFMAELSQASGGEVLQPGEPWSPLPRVQPNVSRVNRRVAVPLWSSAWLLGALCALLSVEWLLRRRWGLA